MGNAGDDFVIWSKRIFEPDVATVGAALRGRPPLKNTLFRETGGHGVPPLQLLRQFNYLFQDFQNTGGDWSML